MIEVKIKISEMDYGTAADALMPVLLDKLSGSGNPVMKILLGKFKGMSGPMAKAALDALPQETKDQLAAACLNHYSDKISRLVVDTAQKNGIKVRVEGVEAAIDH